MSPMGEEILSPTSPPSSRTPPQQLKQNVVGGSSPAASKIQGVKTTDGQKSEELSGRKPAGLPKGAGLNLVTDFSSLPAREQQEGREAHARPRKDSLKANLSSLSALGHRRSGKSLKGSDSKGRLEDLRRADSKTSNLSPSDRAVVIGISVPQEKVADHARSPGSDVARSLGGDIVASQRASVTPSILITPAKEEAPWASSEDDKSQPLRRRATSSVYSQAPTAGQNYLPSSPVPPVPPLPTRTKERNLRIDTNRDKPPRVVSSGTIFEGIDTPTSETQSRPDSSHSQLRILKRSSTDTLMTRPRSQGWWNHLISPFWPRSPMTLKSSSAEKLPSPPYAPDSPARTRESLSGENEGGRSKSMLSSRTSWTDSPVEEENEEPAITFDQILGNPRSISASEGDGTNLPYVPVVPNWGGNGAANEYYIACAHDMHNALPYFECQNHTCLPATRGFEANGLHPDDQILSTGRNVGLSETTGEIHMARELDEQEHILPAPSNRFSAAFHEAIDHDSKSRPLSDATSIDDVDATPDVQEARVAPIIKAPEPIPAAQQPPLPKDEAVLAIDPPKTTNHTPPAPSPSLSPARGNVVEEAPPVSRDAVSESPAKRERYRTPPLPPSTPPNLEISKTKPPKRYIAVMPPEPPPHDYESPKNEIKRPEEDETPSRGPLSPPNLRKGADAAHPKQDAYIVNHNYHFQPHAESREATSVADLYPPPKMQEQAPQARAINERTSFAEETRPKSPAKWKACFGGPKQTSKDAKMTKKKKRTIILIGLALLSMVILILILAMTLTRRGDRMPVQSEWLNLTGYPPIPTGVLTIAQPDAASEVSGCVSPETMWSCALPKEEQKNVSSGAPDQPSFRVEIRFQNGTNVSSAVNSTSLTKRSSKYREFGLCKASVGRFLVLKRSFTSGLFNPSPTAPSREDQAFLGNTTDGNHEPFDGEYTPFFMTFDPADPLASPSRLVKRTVQNSTDPFPNLSSTVPNASTNPDGSASPANLYPYPTAQPLRLYDRGLSSEHYGFYNYFDRSIFLKSSTIFNSSSGGSGNNVNVPDDENGGASEDSAKIRCTWTQTRFLVQIWTKKGNPYPLLSSNNSTQKNSESEDQSIALSPDTNTNSNNSTSSSSSSSSSSASLANSSANDFTRPGSFPYPISITIDRHGGDIKAKNLFCYGLDDEEKPIPSEKKIQLENREFSGGGGVGGGKGLINPALGPFGHVNVTEKEGGPGGIDGGVGGCLCRWQNWS